MKTDAVEAHALTGEHDLRRAAAMLAEMRPKEIVLTHRDGLLVLAGGAYFEADFTPRRMLGRSGRGDTCIASYVGKRLRASAADATCWAAAATSLKLEQEGPIRVPIAEVASLYERIRSQAKASARGTSVQ
ncbi:MAG TPA: hypothetical protein VFA60_15855 [Terriglobales bacterium]|nr:hypothetical protein [Terriglobales bacterium]